MKNIKDATNLVDTLSNANVERREILRLLFALDAGGLHSTTLDLVGFSQAEVRAHLASLSYEGYDWKREASPVPDSLLGAVYTLRPIPPEVIA